jgi:glycosyltransferase involved in cell wall biosynthesis
VSDPFAALPAPLPGCRLTVAIPARDEERLIARALAALARQRDLDGAPLAPDLFDVLVFANGCRDRTARAARAALAPHVRAYVVEGTLPAGAAHVGTARKLVMDAAARRFEHAGRFDALIASTDADSEADPDWIAWTLAEARTVDAVAGRIVLAPGERGELSAAAHALYSCEDAYRRTVADLEDAHDPLPEDPAPRHGQHFGASFAVRVRAYRAAGGVPPLPALEDVALYEALLRADARVRHSPRVRVTTSPRREPRAHGGLGTFLGDLHALGRRGAPWLVDDPRDTLARVEARAALRRIWRGQPRRRDLALTSAAFALTRERWDALFDRGEPFGRNYERIAAGAGGAWRRYAPVPVNEALAVLRPLLASANAVRPTRSSAASGAG